jgi:hypothetical protein
MPLRDAAARAAGDALHIRQRSLPETVQAC